jgi:hypothetical protein
LPIRETYVVLTAGYKAKTALRIGPIGTRKAAFFSECGRWLASAKTIL